MFKALNYSIGHLVLPPRSMHGAFLHGFCGDTNFGDPLTEMSLVRLEEFRGWGEVFRFPENGVHLHLR